MSFFYLALCLCKCFWLLIFNFIKMSLLFPSNNLVITLSVCMCKFFLFVFICFFSLSSVLSFFRLFVSLVCHLFFRLINCPLLFDSCFSFLLSICMLMECYATAWRLCRTVIYCRLAAHCGSPSPFHPSFSGFIFLVHPIWFSLPVWLDIWQHEAQPRAGRNHYSLKAQ